MLTEILRDGAARLLATAVEAEVAGYIDQHAGQVDAKRHRLVVRNGHQHERAIQTGLGSVQGNRILTGQQFEQVVVAPCGIKAFAFNSTFFAGFAS